MALAAGCNSGDKHAIHNAAAVSGAPTPGANPGKKEVTEQFQAQKKMLCPMPGISVV